MPSVVAHVAHTAANHAVQSSGKFVSFVTTAHPTRRKSRSSGSVGVAGGVTEGTAVVQKWNCIECHSHNQIQKPLFGTTM